ncbi:hypothetical protein Tco_0676882 [Tanacetum coccineum]
MRRQGKDFLGAVTPLFATMLIQPQADVGEGLGQPTEPQHTPTTASPSNIKPIPIIASSSQPQKTHKRRKNKRPTEISQSSGPTTLVADETVHKERGDSMERAATTACWINSGKKTKSSRKETVSKKRAEIVPRDDEAVNVESLSTKYLIVDWKIHILAEDKMYYQIIRAYGSEKYYQIFSAVLDDFDIQDVLDLYGMVKERFKTASPEGYDRLLWKYSKSLLLLVVKLLLLVLVTTARRVSADVPCLGDVSWGWRNLLQIRSIIRPFVRDKVHNVRDLIFNGVWRWPSDWCSRFPDIALMQVPMLQDELDDVILWRDIGGVFRPFSVTCVWDTIKLRADVIDWFHVVWFPPLYSSTCDSYVACDQREVKDTRPAAAMGLCIFHASLVSVRVLFGMDSIPPQLVDVIAFLIPISMGRSVICIVSRILLVATTYYLWNERNSRLFKKKTSTAL